MTFQINGFLFISDSQQEAMIREALDIIEDHTCVTYNEVFSPNLPYNYIYFSTARQVCN